MINTVKCPNCGKPVEISQALVAEQLEEAKKEVAATMEVEVKEEKKRNRELQEEMADLLKQMREMKRREEEQELLMAKKIAAEEDKIRDEAKKKTLEEVDLKILEKDKKITDMEKMIEELKKTAQQGSQQTQGEVLELELERLIRAEFPNDVVSEVAKGIRGADVIQEVHDKNGRHVGTILWESKNAKWSANWINKLKDDQREVKADLAILLSVDLPKEYQPFKMQSGVWITNRESAIPLTSALRLELYKVYSANNASIGKNEKMEILYKYFTGPEFKQRVEGIVEAFSMFQEDIEKEKRLFMAKWARQEKQLRKVIDQTHSMYGDLQGITGNNLPEIKSLEA